MKKVLSILSVFVLLFLFIFGCSKNNPTTPSATATATTIPTPVPLVYVNALVLQMNGNAVVVVSLKAGTSTGSALSGATVKVSGATISESTTAGTYTGSITGGFTAGTTITLALTTSIGNINGSVIMPTGATITTPTNGSTINHTTMFQVNWTGSGAGGTNVWVYVTNPVSPIICPFVASPSTSYMVAANTLSTGNISVSVTSNKGGTLTNAVSSSKFIVGNSANTMNYTMN